MRVVGWNSIVGVEGVGVELVCVATIMGAVVAVSVGRVTVEHLHVAMACAMKGRQGQGHVLGALGTGVVLGEGSVRGVESGLLLRVEYLLLMLLVVQIGLRLTRLLDSMGCLAVVLLDSLVVNVLEVIGIELFDGILRRHALNYISECFLHLGDFEYVHQSWEAHQTQCRHGGSWQPGDVEYLEEQAFNLRDQSLEKFSEYVRTHCFCGGGGGWPSKPG